MIPASLSKDSVQLVVCIKKKESEREDFPGNLQPLPHSMFPSFPLYLFTWTGNERDREVARQVRKVNVKS